MKGKVSTSITVKLSPDGKWENGKISFDSKMKFDCKLVQIDSKGNISIMLGGVGRFF